MSTAKRRADYLTMVANQMMKGVHHGWPKATAKQRELFKKRHTKQIEWIISLLPKTSAAVPAVMMKCLIKYGPDKVIKFCAGLKDGLFNGSDDPAHMLWKFFLGHAGKQDVNLVYRKIVCAAKAYMDNKKINGIRPAKTDIFEWDEGFTVPDEYLANWTPDEIPTQEAV